MYPVCPYHEGINKWIFATISNVNTQTLINRYVTRHLIFFELRQQYIMSSPDMAFL